MALNRNSSMKSELWRDMWWTKYSLILCLLFVCFTTWKFLMKLFTRGKAMYRQVKDSAWTSPQPNLENESKDADEDVEFHEFPDYGSQFIKEKKRLQRMPSTLTHSAFSSMIRQRKNSGQIPTTPSFPAISKELLIEEAKNDPTLLTCSSNEKKSRYSSGDAGAVMKGRLTPVPEEVGPIEDDMSPAKRTDSSTNTDFVQGSPSSPFVLHQYPRSVDGEHVSRARSFETRLRYLDIPFTVVYDCDGFNGPWIDIDEGRIEGVECCTKYIELKFKTVHGIRLLEDILEKDNSSFYYLTNFEGDAYRPQNRNLMFNGDQCYNIGECRNYENDGQSEEDDPYIDDNFGDMEVLSSGGEGSVNLT